MKRSLLATLCLAPLFLAACAGPGYGEEPKTFAGIYMYQSNINRGQYEVRISPAGEVTVQLQRGSGDVQRGATQLTPAQTAALFDALKGWKKLDSAYPGDWSNLIQITYDSYKVEIHDPQQAPKNFLTVEALLIDYAGKAMTAGTAPAASQPASQPASQTAPATAP